MPRRQHRCKARSISVSSCYNFSTCQHIATSSKEETTDAHGSPRRRPRIPAPTLTDLRDSGSDRASLPPDHA
uniref:Uncharacterized protein n=1 Tax=Steinernema glaseri TaxID=37863 RepID=A0A1I7ZEP9_9BILA